MGWRRYLGRKARAWVDSQWISDGQSGLPILDNARIAVGVQTHRVAGRKLCGVARLMMSCGALTAVDEFKRVAN